MVYKCRVVHRNDVLSPNLDQEIAASAYAGGDYHRVWGRDRRVCDGLLIREHPRVMP